MLISLSRVLEGSFQHHLDDLPQSSGGNISTSFGRFAPWVLERLTGRYLLDKQMEGEKPIHRKYIACEPAERDRERDATPLKLREKRKRRCYQMTSSKCRQWNGSFCISPCFEIFRTKQEFLLTYKKSRLSSDSSTEELFQSYDLYTQEERQNSLYWKLLELLLLWHMISFQLFSMCEISLI